MTKHDKSHKTVNLLFLTAVDECFHFHFPCSIVFRVLRSIDTQKKARVTHYSHELKGPGGSREHAGSTQKSERSEVGVGRSQLDEICLLLRFERLNSFALDDASVSACIQWDAACRVSSCATPATRSSSCLRLLSMKTNIHAEPRSGQQIQYRICPGSFVARQLHSQAQLYLHRCYHMWLLFHL